MTDLMWSRGFHVKHFGSKRRRKFLGGPADSEKTSMNFPNISLKPVQGTPADAANPASATALADALALADTGTRGTGEKLAEPSEPGEREHMESPRRTGNSDDTDDTGEAGEAGKAGNAGGTADSDDAVGAGHSADAGDTAAPGDAAGGTDDVPAGTDDAPAGDEHNQSRAVSDARVGKDTNFSGDADGASGTGQEHPETGAEVDDPGASAVITAPQASAEAVASATLGSSVVVAPEDSGVVDTPKTSDEVEDTPLAREIADLTRRRSALAAVQLPLPPSTRIFTVANQKGGVGKTTTTVNLAAALALGGARVLVIDLDPQGNASTALGVDHRAETPSVYDVIIDDEPMTEIVQKSPEFDGLYCLPSTIHLAGAEIELVSMVAREQRLRTSLLRFLNETPELFHYVFIDCPPSLGLLTINAFVAASEVLIPIQCEYYALEGLSQLLNNISLIERHLNPTLTVSTILLTMFDSRTNLANQVAQDVRDHFPDQVLPTPIPRSVRISEAPSYGQTVISYDTNSAGSLSYREAAAEIARRGAPN